jgi:LuxR family transcriptional regulator, maltose regulon positive regulatory protein
VLETKLDPPPARPGLVERASLLRRMLGEGAAVIVVGAPAGYGKTVLMAQYAAVTDRRIAWISLGSDDSDPVLLALELATAIDRVAPVDDRVFASLGSPAPALERVVLPGLVNGLRAAGHVALALDDLHLVEGPRSRAVLTFLCEHLPPGAQLLVACRDTSILPLGRLRVRGGLLELDWRDLALDRDEADGLLRATGAPQEGEGLDAILERTEGWPAGVYLAALALRDGADGHRPAIGVAGDDRVMIDYLSGELLTRLPPDRLSFLLRTSILDRLSAPLCDAVLDREDSAQVIAELEGSNLFVQPLDRRRRWYRYHQLFRDALRAELERREPRSAPSLHRRASRWHEHDGTPEEAVHHALAARDMDRATELVVRRARELVNVGRLATVLRWLGAFREDEVGRSGPLAMTGAWGMLLSGERERARWYVAVAAGATWHGLGVMGEPTLEAAVALIKAVAGWEGVSRMHADALDAYRLLPAGHPAHEPASLALGCSLLMLGRTEQAVPFLEEAAALGAARATASLVAEGVLAQIALDEGRVEAAEARVDAGLAMIADLGLGESIASVGGHRGRLPQVRPRRPRAGAPSPRGGGLGAAADGGAAVVVDPGARPARPRRARDRRPRRRGIAAAGRPAGAEPLPRRGRAPPPAHPRGARPRARPGRPGRDRRAAHGRGAPGARAPPDPSLHGRDRRGAPHLAEHGEGAPEDDLPEARRRHPRRRGRARDPARAPAPGRPVTRLGVSAGRARPGPRRAGRPRTRAPPAARRR